jgi:hypothetical protein
MTPVPNLQELIDAIRADAASDDALAQLAMASTTVTELSDTGDAALGYFVDRARGAGHSWVEISGVLGVSKQAAHKRFSIAAVPSSGFDRFTDRARNALTAAHDLAVQRNHGYVNPEHILLGLYVEPKSIATKILVAEGLTREVVDPAVRALVPDGDVTDGDIRPYTPRAAKYLQRTVSIALELGHNYVGTEHLLLAFFGDTGGIAAKVLEDLGLTEQTARAGVEKALGRLKK